MFSGGGFIFTLISSLSSLSITTLLLTFSVIYVNGLTDAPNSVATCITTRCLPLKPAVFLSAIFNFAGVFITSKINPAVTDTVMNMVSFGENSEKSSIALAAALFSIVLWAVVAWYFGIPTSESHALIAGLTGSALAINGGFSGINSDEWIKAIYGLFTSCGLGFLGGAVICRVILSFFKNVKRQKAEKIFRYAQIFASAIMSFMHGAQDGQKFLAVIIMCINLQSNTSPTSYFVIACSLVMALGTLTGGKKIIKSIGMDMVKLEKYQGFSADLAAALALLLSTVCGFPVSTTHAKTTAIMGAGFAVKRKNVNTAVIKDIALTWLLTFPGCTILGYVMTNLFLKIFAP